MIKSMINIYSICYPYMVDTWTVKIQNCVVHQKSYWTNFKLESLELNEPHLFPSSKKKCKLSWISGLLLLLLYCCSSPLCVRCQACKLWLMFIFMPCIEILQGWSGTLWYHKAPHVWSRAAAWRVVNEGWTTDPGNKGWLQCTCSPFQSLSLLCNCGPLWKFALKRQQKKNLNWIGVSKTNPKRYAALRGRGNNSVAIVSKRLSVTQWAKEVFHKKGEWFQRSTASQLHIVQSANHCGVTRPP